jgi:hypothetical protein
MTEALVRARFFPKPQLQPQPAVSLVSKPRDQSDDEEEIDPAVITSFEQAASMHINNPAFFLDQPVYDVIDEVTKGAPYLRVVRIENVLRRGQATVGLELHPRLLDLAIRFLRYKDRVGVRKKATFVSIFSRARVTWFSSTTNRYLRAKQLATDSLIYEKHLRVGKSTFVCFKSLLSRETPL